MAGVAALAVDPERLLWRPEAKTIFIPPAIVAVPQSREVSLTIQVMGPMRRSALPITPSWWTGQSECHMPGAATRALAGANTQLSIGGREIVDIKEISLDAVPPDLIEVNSWNDVSSSREYISGLRDGLEMNVVCDFHAQPALATMLGRNQTYRVDMPGLASYEFEGIVKEMTETGNV